MGSEDTMHPHGDGEAPETTEGELPQTLPQGLPTIDESGSLPSDRGLPDHLGPFRLISEIGRGGMGVVFRAFQPELKRTVALKILVAGEDASPEAIARFHREAQAVAKLGHHPNIVPVFDVGRADSSPTSALHYIAMHYVEGPSLDRLIDRGVLPPRQAGKITLDLARALKHAHHHGILHRDVKPANVLMASDTTPQLTDFGLAKDVESDASVTRSGITLGTPHYMPPEQADGRHGDIDGRSDIFSLGATLYEMLTSHPPFEGGTVAEVLRKVLLEDPVPPRRKNPNIDRDLETICLKCLDKEPGRRYVDAGALADDLDNYLAGGPIAARRASAFERLWRKTVKRPRLAAGLIVAAIALTVAAAIAANALVQGSKARQAAEQGREAAEERSQLERDRTARKDLLLQKNQAVSTALMKVQGRLSDVFRRMEALHYDETRSADEKSVEAASMLSQANDVLVGSRSSPPAKATLLALKGWLAWRAGDREAASASFARARDIDGDVAWAPFLQTMTWLEIFLSAQPLPQARFSQAGARFGDFPDESESQARARRELEKGLEEIRSFSVWGTESPDEIDRVLEGLSAMVGGRPAVALEGLNRAQEAWFLSWVREEIRLARAKVLFQLRDYHGAAKDIEAHLQGCPRHTGARLFLGLVLSSKGVDAGASGADPRPAFGAAVAAYSEALRLDPASERVRLGRALISLQLAEWENRWGNSPNVPLEAAIADLVAELEDHPDNVRAHLLHGYALWTAGRISKGDPAEKAARLHEAQAAFDRVLARSPSHSEALSLLGRVKVSMAELGPAAGLDAGQCLSSAIRTLDRALETAPGVRDLLMTRGIASQRMGEICDETGKNGQAWFQKALSDFKTLIANDGTDVQARVYGANALKSLGDLAHRRGQDPAPFWDEAQNLFQAALELAPAFLDGVNNLAQLRIAKAEFARGSGRDPFPDLDAAEEVLANAIEAGSEDTGLLVVTATVLRTRARIEAATGRNPMKSLDRAIGAATRVVESAPAEETAWIERGLAFLSLGEFLQAQGKDPRDPLSRAIADFRECLRRNSENVVVYVNLAVAHYDLGQEALRRRQDGRPEFQKAIDAATEALKRNPRNLGAVNNRGNAHNALGQVTVSLGGDGEPFFRNAIEDFDNLLSANPRSVSGHMNRANACVNLGESQAARTGSPQPWYDRAMEAYRHAADLNSRLWQVHANLGILLEKKGDFEKALLAYQKAYDIVGDGSPAVKSWLDRARTRAAMPAPIQRLVYGRIAVMLNLYGPARTAFEAGFAALEKDPEPAVPFPDLIAGAHVDLARILSVASEGRGGPKGAPSPIDGTKARALRVMALGHLRKGIESGWQNRALLETHADLEPLRKGGLLNPLLDRTFGEDEDGAEED